MSTRRKPYLADPLRSRARALRRNLTKAEERLWYLLRHRRLDGLHFRRQHPIAGFIADFYCHDARIVVEADGGSHVDGARYDANRTRIFEELGIRVLRFWNDEILGNTEAVLEKILELAKERRSKDRPTAFPIVLGTRADRE